MSSKTSSIRYLRNETKLDPSWPVLQLRGLVYKLYTPDWTPKNSFGSGGEISRIFNSRDMHRSDYIRTNERMIMEKLIYQLEQQIKCMNILAQHKR